MKFATGVNVSCRRSVVAVASFVVAMVMFVPLASSVTPLGNDAKPPTFVGQKSTCTDTILVVGADVTVALAYSADIVSSSILILLDVPVSVGFNACASKADEPNRPSVSQRSFDAARQKENELDFMS